MEKDNQRPKRKAIDNNYEEQNGRSFKVRSGGLPHVKQPVPDSTSAGIGMYKSIKTCMRNKVIILFVTCPYFIYCRFGGLRRAYP